VEGALAEWRDRLDPGLVKVAEAGRQIGAVVLVDSRVPLPKNSGGRSIRFVEATFGRDHHRHFKDFLAAGGITAVLEAAALPVAVSHRAVFWRECREVVVVTKEAATADETPQGVGQGTTRA
jgi:hypothetical protein